EDLRSVAATIPPDRLLVETDSPYLAPVPVRGKRNEPAYVAHTVALLADLRGVPPDDLAAQTTKNARELFSLEPGQWPAAADRTPRKKPPRVNDRGPSTHRSLTAGPRRAGRRRGGGRARRAARRHRPWPGDAAAARADRQLVPHLADARRQTQDALGDPP